MLLDDRLDRFPAPTVRPRRSRTTTVALTTFVFAALGVQLVVLLARSRQQWQHFNLSIDFAIFHQAWHQIGRGDLDPLLTTLGYPYWQSHFELIMWPLALLGRLHRDDGLGLLYLQDLAIVASEAVVVAWIRTETRERDTRTQWIAVSAVVVLMVANPWVYRAAMQDFHFEALGTFFTLLAAWDLWRGRRRGWIWVALALSCGDVSGTYMVGLGLSFVVAGRRTRRVGAALGAVGLLWVVLAALLHANRGSGIAEYAYLASTTKPVSAGIAGVGAILWGVVHHPSRPIQMLGDRLGKIWLNLAPVGTAGVVAPWSFGVMVAVLLTNALNARPGFIDPSYQDVPVALFGALGTVLLAIALSARPGRVGALGVMVVAALAISAIVFDATHFHRVDAAKVSPFAAGELAAVRREIPDDAQVVVSFGVAGRFAGRRWVHVLSYGGQSFPVESRTVVFVFAPAAGNQPVPLTIVERAERFVRDTLRARVLRRGVEVNAYEWRPHGLSHVELP